MTPQKITAYPTKMREVGSKIKTTVYKLPYLERGRRVNFGACSICGHYYLKKSRTIIVVETQDKQRFSNKYNINYVVCPYNVHGTTEIDKQLLTSLYLANGNCEGGLNDHNHK